MPKRPRSSMEHNESGMVDDSDEFDVSSFSTDRKTSPTRSDHSAITISSTDSGVSFNENLKYHFRTYLQERRKQILWSIEFNHFLKPNEPNIFAVVGGRQISIYETKSDGTMKHLITYEDPNDKEDFYTCCWTVLGAKNHQRSVLLVGGVRGIIRIFKPERPAITPTHLIGHGGAVNQVKVSRKNPFLLASASSDRSIRLWNIQTKVCIATFHSVDGHRDDVVTIDFNLDCTRLVSGGVDHMIAIWDLTIPKIEAAVKKSETYDEKTSDRSFETVYHPFPMFSTRLLHSNYIDCIQWFSGLILSKSTENDLYCWELIEDNKKLNFRKIVEFDLDNCSYYFERFAISYDRSVLALGNDIGKIRLWNMDCADPTRIPTTTLTHRQSTKTIRDLSFSRCGRDLVFCDEGGRIWLYQR